MCDTGRFFRDRACLALALTHANRNALLDGFVAACLMRIYK